MVDEGVVKITIDFNKRKMCIYHSENEKGGVYIHLANTKVTMVPKQCINRKLIISMLTSSIM